MFAKLFKLIEHVLTVAQHTNQQDVEVNFDYMAPGDPDTAERLNGTITVHLYKS